MIPAHIVGRPANRALEQMGDALLQHLVGRKPDRVEDTLGFEVVVDLRRGERRIATKTEADLPFLVALDDRLQHVAPFVGAMHVPGAKGAALQVAEQQEQRVIAGAGEMAVAGRALLLAMGRADRAVHVENDPLRWVAVMNPVDPDARKVSERGEVVIVGEELGLEPAHLADRCAATFNGRAADDPAHRGIAPEPAGVVHVLVSGEASIDGLAEQTDDAVPDVLAGAVVANGAVGRCGQAESVVEFTVGEQTRVGREPRAMEIQLQAAAISRRRGGTWTKREL